MEMLVFVVVLLAFAEAAARWGANSSERIHSREWQRRLQLLGAKVLARINASRPARNGRKTRAPMSAELSLQKEAAGS